MKWGVLLVFIFWYGLISFVFTIIPPAVQGSPSPLQGNYVNINVSGFDSGEIDSGGFWSGTLGIIISVLRFFGFILIGIVPSGWGVPVAWQVFLFFWNTSITICFIAWVISIFWDG